MNNIDNDNKAFWKDYSLGSILTISAAILSLILLVLLIRQGIHCITVPFFAYNGPHEGVELIAAVRLLEHKPLYPDYLYNDIYYLYGPLMPIVFLVAMKLFGINLVTLKVLAFIACVLILIGVSYGSYRITKSILTMILAAGAFCALYRFSGLWFFNIRPDIFGATLSVWGLLFAGQYLAKRNSIWPGLVACCLFTLASLTKQNYLILPLCYLGYLMIKTPIKTGLIISIPFVLIFGTAMLWFNTGDENFYSLTMLFSKQSFDKVLPTHLDAMGIPLFLFILATGFTFRAGQEKVDLTFWLLMTGLSFILGQVSFMKQGGGQYAFVFFCAMVSMLSAVIIVKIRDHSFKFSRLTFLLILFSFNVFLFNEIDFFTNQLKYVYGYPIPRASYEFIKNNKDKRVYFPTNNYITYLAAGQYYHNDFLSKDLYWVGLKAPQSIVTSIKTRYFDLLIGDFVTEELKTLRHKHYKLYGYILPSATEVYMRR